MRKTKDEYTPEEIEQRALDMARRSFALPHKTAKDFKGKTPRAKAMARRGGETLRVQNLHEPPQVSHSALLPKRFTSRSIGQPLAFAALDRGNSALAVVHFAAVPTERHFVAIAAQMLARDVVERATLERLRRAFQLSAVLL